MYCFGSTSGFFAGNDQVVTEARSNMAVFQGCHL